MKNRSPLLRTRSRGVLAAALVAAVATALLGASARPQEAAPAGAIPGPGVTVRVSVDADGQERAESAASSTISPDGATVAFFSRHPSIVPDAGVPPSTLWLRDLGTGELRVLDPVIGGHSLSGSLPSLSADGRLAAVACYDSEDPSAGDGRGYVVVDRDGRLLAHVDGRREGIAGPVAWSKPTALSADGRTLVFGTTADFGRGKRLAGSYLLDLEADAVSVLPCGAERLWSFDASISADGRRIVVYHMQMPDADPRPSGIYLLDRDAGTATPLVAGPGEAAIEKAGMPCLSADGRWVVFCSLEVPGIAGGANDTRDVFRFDTVSRTVELVSVAEHGGSGNGVSDLWPGGRAVSADGRFVLFTSEASDLVAGDGNGLGDVFVRDMQAGSTVRVSLSRDGGDADAKSSWPAISSDGRRVAFTSEATNLVEGDRNGKEDVFVRELAWDD